MRPAPPLADRDWYTAVEVVDRLEAGTTLRAVYRHAEDLGVKYEPTAGLRRAHRFPKSVIDPLTGKGISSLVKSSSPHHTVAGPVTPAIPTTKAVGTDASLLTLITGMRAEIQVKDERIEQLLTEQGNLKQSLQRADDRYGQIEQELAVLRGHYNDLLSIAKRAGEDSDDLLDRAIPHG